MKAASRTFLAVIGGAIIGAGMVGLALPRRLPTAIADPLPTHHDSATGGVDIVLCDGVTRMKVPGLKPGQKMPRAQALAVTRDLMAQWQRKHPGEHWVMAQNETATPATSQSAPEPGQRQTEHRRSGWRRRFKTQGSARRHLRELHRARLQGMAGADRRFRRRGQAHLPFRRRVGRHYRRELRYVPPRRG